MSPQGRQFERFGRYAPSRAGQLRLNMYFRVIFRNILSTWIGYAVSLAIGFLLAPFVVHRLGTTGYGVWTLIVSLTGYFGILDMGLRQSVGRFIARYVALKDHESVNRTISSALAALITAGLLALVATVVISSSFGMFKIAPQFSGAARIALLIAGLNIAIALPMSVFNAVLFSLERFDIVTGVTVLGGLVRAALVVTVLHLNYGIIALAAVTLTSSLGEYITLAICANKIYKHLNPGLHLVDRARCKELFHFGIYRFIWIVGNQVIFYTDSIVIGVFLSASAITYYAIAGSLINYGRNIVSVAMDTLFPAATRFDANNDNRGLQDLLVVGTHISLLIGLPLCFGYIFLGRQFIGLWVGSSFASSALYLTVLTIPQFTSLAQYISALILVGMGRHKILAYITLAEAVANLVLSILLVRKLGLVGVAWGTVIPHLITTAVVIPLYTLRMLNMKPLDYIRRALVRPVLAGIPAGILCYVFSLTVDNPDWFGFAGEVVVVAAVSGIMGGLLCLTTAQRSSILQRARRFVRRDAVADAA